MFSGCKTCDKLQSKVKAYKRQAEEAVSTSTAREKHSGAGQVLWRQNLRGFFKGKEHRIGNMKLGLKNEYLEGKNHNINYWSLEDSGSSLLRSP